MHSRSAVLRGRRATCLLGVGGKRDAKDVFIAGFLPQSSSLASS